MVDTRQVFLADPHKNYMAVSIKLGVFLDIVSIQRALLFCGVYIKVPEPGGAVVLVSS